MHNDRKRMSRWPVILDWTGSAITLASYCGLAAYTVGVLGQDIRTLSGVIGISVGAVAFLILVTCPFPPQARWVALIPAFLCCLTPLWVRVFGDTRKHELILLAACFLMPIQLPFLGLWARNAWRIEYSEQPMFARQEGDQAKKPCPNAKASDKHAVFPGEEAVKNGE